MLKLFLIFLVAFVAESDGVAMVAERGNDYDHVVYVGDSIMRYQVLAFLYEIHHHKPSPLNLTFNDGPNNASAPNINPTGLNKGKWGNYLQWSTDVFEGHMVCDCFRGKVMGNSNDIFENRFYSHPNGNFHVSYFQKFGDAPAKGKLRRADMRVYDNLAQAKAGLWWSLSQPALFLDQVRLLTPPPTVLVLNQKPWVTPFRRSSILEELPGALRAALEAVHTVLWLQGTPTRSELQGMRRPGGSYPDGPVDTLVRDVLCNQKSRRHVRVMRNGVPVTCIYVPFPEDLFAQLAQGDPRLFFHDIYHFSDPAVYLRRNTAALEAAGVMHHLDKINTSAMI